MTHKSISVENLGPISSLEFALGEPGVTVLVAPNGSGKTILLEAVQAAARGEGKLPLRDRTKRGKVEAFGATITIGGTCRHTGGFEVTNLEGRFDLAGLVDPRIKAPALADKARIKALVSLTGVEASVTMFRQHEALAESFGKVVKASSTETDDPIEMAIKIKADYDEAARAQEDAAERETGHATALIPPSDLDLEDIHDAALLQRQYNKARDVQTRLLQQAELATAGRSKVMQADKLLKELGDDDMRKERDMLSIAIQHSDNQVELNTKDIAECEEKIRKLKDANQVLHQATIENNARITAIARQLVLVDAAKKTLAENLVEFPSDDEHDEAAEAVSFAQQAVERGTLIRQALKDAEKSATHRKAAGQARALALKYRDAGKATDEVLSECIKCPQLRVESDGKAARLVSDTERGKSIPYHDLSDGEKWTIAIDIGADQVGEGGLLVISQVGWEGIDGANRLEIHQHAVNRGVYILTAEASSDPKAKREIVPTRLPDVPRESIPKAIVKEAAQILSDEAKPKAAAKAAYKPVQKPLPKPVEPSTYDSDDIPF